MKALAIAGLLFAVAVLSGCVGVGTRVCTVDQAGCDFTDHVLTVSPSGTFCPTWNVQFAHYNPSGQPTDTYSITTDPAVEDEIVATLTQASRENLPVHVWYAGNKYVLYEKCKADHPLVIYRAELVQG